MSVLLPAIQDEQQHISHLNVSCEAAHDSLLEPTLELPEFTPLAAATFTWGKYDSSAFIQSLNATYSEVMY